MGCSPKGVRVVRRMIKKGIPKNALKKYSCIETLGMSSSYLAYQLNAKMIYYVETAIIDFLQNAIDLKKIKGHEEEILEKIKKYVKPKHKLLQLNKESIKIIPLLLKAVTARIENKIKKVSELETMVRKIIYKKTKQKLEKDIFMDSLSIFFED